MQASLLCADCLDVDTGQLMVTSDKMYNIILHGQSQRGLYVAPPLEVHAKEYVILSNHYGDCGASITGDQTHTVGHY